MKRIQLWSIRSDETGLSAVSVASRESADAEAQLEELLVRSPNLLADGLTLIGRQVQTDGGPLDLLGVDEDGRLVVFELKKGVLTRDAVAQVLDYASDLANDAERLARLVQDFSGRLGIDKIEDFEDWYAQRFRDSSGVLSDPPRMVLVGLGVDDRARRIVDFLVDSGVEIELLTFHAFESDGKLFLARQVESAAPVHPPRTAASSPTKEGNRKVLHESARSLGVLDLLEEVAAVVADHVQDYQWPGKTAYTFYLSERTAEGNPTLRSYTRLDLDRKQPGSLKLVLIERAVQSAPNAVDAFRKKLPAFAVENAKYNQLEIAINRANWSQIAAELKPLLEAVVSGAKARLTAEQSSSSQEASVQEGD